VTRGSRPGLSAGCLSSRTRRAKLAVMRITTLSSFPVKGCHRLDHDQAVVEPWGLAGDRRWMMVDPDGVGITQREAPRLTRLAARPRPGGLTLSAPGLPTLEIDEPADGPEESVRIFRSEEPVPVRIAETTWSSAFLGREARLAWQADPTGRPLGSPADAGHSVSLADGFPLLLANAASLDAVNDWLAADGDEPVPMTRFRPNLVVGGAPAWAEDDWLGRRLRIGEVTFHAAQSCARCMVTTIDQETGEQGRQPLRALGEHRRYEDGLLFAINLVPGATGLLRVGDVVSVLD
jgi:MOSC domain-containing protein